jgi:hypothetical protein
VGESTHADEEEDKGYDDEGEDEAPKSMEEIRNYIRYVTVSYHL